MRWHKRSMLFVMSCLLSIMLLGSMALAQNNETILTISFPKWAAENANITEETFADFEAQHPGVKVVYVDAKDLSYVAPPTYIEIDEHLTQAANLAATADVIYLLSGTSTLTLETTRAGLFLDMAPLVAGDTDFFQEDFYPAAWSVYQWDRGIWGIPLTINPYMMIYDRTAFDQAGLAYPDASWTMDTMLHAQRSLLQENAEGQVSNPGLFVYGNASSNLLPLFLNRPLSVPGVEPIQPDFTDPEVEAVIAQWITHMQEGYLGGQFKDVTDSYYDSDAVGMLIAQPQSLRFNANRENGTLGLTLLGDRISSMDTTGFAISSGTRNPELAYELIKFITSEIEIVNPLSHFEGYPARYSIATDPNSTAIESLQLSDEEKAVIEQALQNPTTPAEQQLANYLDMAIYDAQDESKGLTLQMALEEAEMHVVNNLAAAENYALNQTPIAVITPVPTAVLASGEVAIRFAINTNYGDLFNEPYWNQVIDDFVANDPQVGRLTVNTVNTLVASDLISDYDCFYLPLNLTDTQEVVNLLSLDPFLDADPYFDRNGFLGSVLQQVQKDNRTWGYPLDIKPEVLWYHVERFNEDGIPLPDDGWTTDAFIDALNTLKQTQPDDQPLRSRAFGTNTTLLMFIAAYGGLPFDYRTTPHTVNLTTPENIEATQQVVDLVKNGYIEYMPLSPLYWLRDDASSFNMHTNQSPDAIYSDVVAPYNFGNYRYDGFMENAPTYQLVSYPQGTQYLPLTYDLGVAYISATTQHPEACYRWISTIAQNPVLLNSIPTQRALIHDPQLHEATGIDISSYIEQLDSLMSHPLLVEFPSQSAAIYIDATAMLNQYMQQIWFNEAIDNAVIDDGELAPLLEQAQGYVDEYTSCVASLPPIDSALYTQRSMVADEEAANAMVEGYTNCAVQTDPRLAEMFK